MKLEAHAVSYVYPGGTRALNGVSIEVASGSVLFVLGANGSGKTTLLDCLAGLRTPTSGSIRVDGVPLDDLTVKERAQRIGMVPQIHDPVFSYTVAQAVLMGRAPHLGPFARPGKADHAAVQDALRAVGAERLAHRPYTEISGGERQLVLVARGLAQGAECLLMDEPAAHLDPHHQHQIHQVVRRLAAEGYCFVVSSHQPNNALFYGDCAGVLVRGAVLTCGSPAAVLTEETLRSVYDMEFDLIRGGGDRTAILPRVG